MKTHELSQGKMPVLGLGTWNSQPGEVYHAVKEAVKMGYRHIDCASIYQNEAEIGKALSELFAEGVVKREDLWITSKLWNNAHAPDDVQPALEKTLKDLRLGYLDLYLIHWPVPIRKDIVMPNTPADFVKPDEASLTSTWQAMEQLVDKNLVRNIGVSNFNVERLQTLLDQGSIKPAVNQIELHPYLQQPAMLDFCQQAGIYLTAYSPLGSKGRPDGMKAADEPVLLEDGTIGAIAQQHGATPAQVLIAWAIQRETMVIPKSVNPARMKQNLEAASLTLTQKDMQEIATLDRHRRYVDGTFWTTQGSPHTLENLWGEPVAQ
ncbi:aldo/keto reductase [uncultured Microscilla sp.]|uniref:aldo/keto reductase n=1 Tax=uncultured Microscilla sp. TaxID=432653 RepID=UPI002616E639|nr:aldo/keto reductase [uncultured Microscilla sp.]